MRFAKVSRLGVGHQLLGEQRLGWVPVYIRKPPTAGGFKVGPSLLANDSSCIRWRACELEGGEMSVCSDPLDKGRRVGCTGR